MRSCSSTAGVHIAHGPTRYRRAGLLPSDREELAHCADGAPSQEV